MAFRTLYKTLLQVNLYHSYFLNDGETTFTSMNDEEKKVQLSGYNFSNYLVIIPSTATLVNLKNNKLVYRKSPGGFRILSSVEEENDRFKTTIFLQEDIRLTFLIYQRDYLFDNYSELPKVANRMYHFSNTKPATETDPYSYIPSDSSNLLITEDFLLSEESTTQLWYDLAQENIKVSNDSRFNLIAEIDAEDFETDEGKAIVNQSFLNEQAKGLLGTISLQMIGDNNMDLVEIDDTDPEDIKSFLVDNTPTYKLHIDNRKTIWKYIKKSENQELETSLVKPLTQKGFIEIDPEDDLVAPLPDDIEKYMFPNPTPDIIKRVTDENTNTTITYSEIYI